MENKNKLFGFLNNNLVIMLWVIAILGVFSFFRSCNTSKEIRKIHTEIEQYQSEIDSLTATLDNMYYDKNELDIRLQIHGLEASKRTLYDWNAVVRTVIRPDDKMKEYDEQIQTLRSQLE